ncbi:MAG: aminotransferase class IV [Bacteroidales bacterium]|nr:aminotransferase class IV [Bacteroidales bacterium]MCF8405103.1 aminotransferase class IV [Bacteroidales bacterium]
MKEVIGNMFLLNGEQKDVSCFDEHHHLVTDFPSVYEVVRVEQGVALFLEDYYERLQNSMRILGKEIPLSFDVMKNSIHTLISKNEITNSPVKLIFGTGDNKYFMAYLMKTNLPQPDEYIAGVKTILMQSERFNPNVKIWNENLRKTSVKLLQQNQAYEALLVNKEGYITEASRSNVFFIKGNQVYTTPADMVLPGITRKKVLEVCRVESIPVSFKIIHRDELPEYEACFLTGTARKVVPVKRIGEIEFDASNKYLQQIALLFEKYVADYILGAAITNKN